MVLHRELRKSGVREESASLPFVSVVVPVYNGERTIQACIDSLMAQDYPQDLYEILIVDNNSTDRTCEIVGRCPVELLHERKVQTSYAARNTGIRHVNGEIVAFTDADCIAEGNWLRELVSPFTNPEVGGVGGQVLDAPPANIVETFLYSMKPFSGYQTESIFLPILMTLNAAYRRDALLAVGLFNQDLYTGADIDLSWRVQLRTGAKVVHTRNAIVFHKHRVTLTGMARQLHRHGFGEILLDAMYKDQPGYRHTLGWQLRRMGRQVRALFTYVLSAFYRLLVHRQRGRDRMYVMSPLLWFVAESANIWGKVQALCATRCLRVDPTQRIWEDPGER